MNVSLQYCTCKPLPHLMFLIRATGRKVYCTLVKLRENKCHEGEITSLSKLSTLDLSYWLSFLFQLFVRINYTKNTTHVVHVTNNNHDLISSVLGVPPSLKL